MMIIRKKNMETDRRKTRRTRERRETELWGVV
jgi:hypothetical protein